MEAILDLFFEKRKWKLLVIIGLLVVSGFLASYFFVPVAVFVWFSLYPRRGGSARGDRVLYMARVAAVVLLLVSLAVSVSRLFGNLIPLQMYPFEAYAIKLFGLAFLVAWILAAIGGLVMAAGEKRGSLPLFVFGFGFVIAAVVPTYNAAILVRDHESAVSNLSLTAVREMDLAAKQGVSHAVLSRHFFIHWSLITGRNVPRFLASRLSYDKYVAQSAACTGSGMVKPRKPAVVARCMRRLSGERRMLYRFSYNIPGMFRDLLPDPDSRFHGLVEKRTVALK